MDGVDDKNNLIVVDDIVRGTSRTSRARRARRTIIIVHGNSLDTNAVKVKSGHGEVVGTRSQICRKRNRLGIGFTRKRLGKIANCWPNRAQIDHGSFGRDKPVNAQQEVLGGPWGHGASKGTIVSVPGNFNRGIGDIIVHGQVELHGGRKHNLKKSNSKQVSPHHRIKRTKTNRREREWESGEKLKKKQEVSERSVAQLLA